MCGADLPSAPVMPIEGGSPPRVRSRHAEHARRNSRVGITSACAEQTTGFVGRVVPDEDHLRVCGADSFPRRGCDAHLGSPPRVRSRRHQETHVSLAVGITSACAEQTPPGSGRGYAAWDHLRVCGADRLGLSFHRVHPGSPPRVRSRRSPTCRGPCQTGITSACAEQTVRGRPSVRRRRDHLRVCGADEVAQANEKVDVGSPPRVRSRLHVRR